MKHRLLLAFSVVVSVFAVLLIAYRVMAGFSIFLPLIQNGNANPAAPWLISTSPDA